MRAWVRGWWGSVCVCVCVVMAVCARRRLVKLKQELGGAEER